MGVRTRSITRALGGTKAYAGGACWDGGIEVGGSETDESEGEYYDTDASEEEEEDVACEGEEVLAGLAHCLQRPSCACRHSELDHVVGTAVRIVPALYPTSRQEPDETKRRLIIAEMLAVGHRVACEMSASLGVTVASVHSDGAHRRALMIRMGA